MRPNGNTRLAPGLPRTTACIAAALLFGVWVLINYPRLTAAPDGWIRLILGSYFGLRLLHRPTRSDDTRFPTGKLTVVAALVASLLFLLGGIFRVHQFEWLGLVGLLYACLHWAFPRKKQGDVGKALLLLYWIHPLPQQVLAPLHLLAQRISVAGSEWMLHAINVRAWGDGMFLRTAGPTLEIPQACSGMRTATTVFLCALGTSFLLRFSITETLVFGVLGIAQGVLLNITRISVMAAMASGRSVNLSSTFLHDSTGALLLLAVLLLQLEAALWERWLRARWRSYRNRRRAGELWLATWSNVAHRLLGVALVVVLCTVAVAAGYKRRPAHRAAMISDVVDGLIRNGSLDAAEAATAKVVQLMPEDPGYRLERVRILLMRRKATQALQELSRYKPSRSSDRFITLEAWALAMAGQTEQAAELLQGLPDHRQRRPLVAMVAAEIARSRKDADAVAEHIVWAARRADLQPMVRTMYPFLAQHGRWSTISDTSDPTPYRSPVLLHTVAYAHLRCGKPDRAAASLQRDHALWTDDPNFLRLLLAVAVTQDTRQWGDAFVTTLAGALDHLPVDDLYEYAEACFRLGRPDAAWMVYTRLRRLAPDHPGVVLIPARFGTQWFSLRRSQLDPSGAGAVESVDVLPALRMLRATPGLGRCIALIPLIDRCTEEGTRPVSQAFRKQAGEMLPPSPSAPGGPALSYSALLAQMHAYELTGDAEHALEVLQHIQTRFPQRAPQLLALRARLCFAAGRYEEAYEAARRIRALPSIATPAIDVLMINVLMHLDLGFYAAHVAEQAARRFPDNSGIFAAGAAVLDAVGHSEEALHLLRRKAREHPSPLLARLLERTGRRSQATGVGRASRRDDDDAPDAIWVLPAAEQSITWTPVPERPATSERGSTGAPHADREAHPSPFLAELAHLTGADVDSAATEAAVREAWRAAGRDDVERAVALHRLSLREARRNERTAARAALRDALELLPDSRFLWRIYVRLHDGRPEMVNTAYERCPQDPEIWLAQLVTIVKAEAFSATVNAFVQESVTDNRFSPGTFVRAGDFLLRSGYEEAARTVCRQAWAADRGYLPACALGLRCALAEEDEDWALQCAIQGATIAATPSPFLKTAVRLKMDAGQHDAALEQHLKVLIEAHPDEQEWVERLGYLQFHQGDTAQAVRTFQPLIQHPDRVNRPGLLIVIAEALRREEHHDEAVKVLKTACGLHPDNVHLLNNLVYTLAEQEETLLEADTLLTRLLEQAQSPAMFDTAAVTAFRLERFDEAGRHMDRALSALTPDSPQWRDMHLDGAELHLAMGNYERAQAVLEHARRATPVWQDGPMADLSKAIEKAMAAEEDGDSAP